MDMVGANMTKDFCTDGLKAVSGFVYTFKEKENA